VSSSVFPNLGLLAEFLIVQMEFSKQKTFSLLSVLPPQFIFAKVSQKSVESFSSWCLNNKHTCRKPKIRILLSIFCLCISYSPHFSSFSLNIFLFKSFCTFVFLKNLLLFQFSSEEELQAFWHLPLSNWLALCDKLNINRFVSWHDGIS
jgi:hypothetical protein